MVDTLEFFHKPSSCIIVSFGGHFEDKRVGGFVFVNFLQQRFAHVNQLFLMDSQCSCYHRGIKGISTNFEETIEFLRKKIRGGYAALLFGSILQVVSVVAFVPPTILMSVGKDDRYRDILPFINETTRYYIYGDCSVTDFNHAHHINHCDRVVALHKSNISMQRMDHVDLRKIRDSGELEKILQVALMK